MKKKQKTKKQLCFDRCEKLWKEIVKLRAGYKSEISGREAKPAHPHHSFGKSSYALRFDLRGGVCLTAREHQKVHNDPSFDEQVKEYVKKREREDIFTILKAQKNCAGVDIYIIELALKQKLKELKNV